MSDREDLNKNNNNNQDQSLEDLLEETQTDTDDGHSTYNYEYEDEYVYGDEDELDETQLGFSDTETHTTGRYEHLLTDEEELDEPIQTTEKLPLQERVSNKVNQFLDFVESKQFTTFQWVMALGILITLGIVVVVLMQASSNLGTNVAHQEHEGAKYVAQEVAPEEYEAQKAHEEESNKQQEDAQSYIDEKIREYEKEVANLGEVPEGHTALQDEDGKVTYISDEEYAELLNSDTVRENTTARGEDTTAAEAIQSLEVEIMPASEEIWHNNLFEPMGSVNEDKLYQSRGQYIYFAQKVIANYFANQILETDFDPNTYTLFITLNEDASFPLPDDFEERMHYVYKNSGYQTQAPDQLTIEYSEMGIDEYMNR